jgi:hypothetical protein
MVDKVTFMDVARLVLLFLHFLGLASLLGGVLVQVRAPDRRILPAMLHGATTQLVTGLALVGVDQALDREVNNPRAAVKLAVLLVILVLLWTNRSRRAVTSGGFFAIGLLTVVNTAIAVFWTTPTST